MTPLRPKDLTTQLGISASTLRLWTEKFGPVLSPSATKATTETGTPAQRRFTEDDLAILIRAKHLLGQNKTYEEALRILQTAPAAVIAPGASETAPSAPASSDVAMTVPLDDHPVFVAFREALAAKDETITTLHLALTRTESELATVQAAKDELVASKDETIAELRTRLKERDDRPLGDPLPQGKDSQSRESWFTRLVRPWIVERHP